MLTLADINIPFRTKQLERGALRERDPGCAARYEIAREARVGRKNRAAFRALRNSTSAVVSLAPLRFQTGRMRNMPNYKRANNPAVNCMLYCR